MSSVKKVVFIGGHHTPALAVVDCLRARLPQSGLDGHFFWIGHKFSMWGDANTSAEYQEVTARGLPFFDLQAGKFHRTLHPLKLLRIPWGFVQSLSYLFVIRPDLVVSFGGYLAVPVVICAWFLRIPAITHEQTTVAGLANLVLSRFVRKIYISFESSARFFPPQKTVLVGNPLREGLLVDRGLFQFQNSRPTIYVTGGKQGAHRINVLISRLLPELLGRFNLIHQCGSSSVFEDFPQLTQVRERLTANLSVGYVLRGFFSESEVGSVFARADLVIGRAGANAVYEIGALGKVAILLPLSWSSNREQESNARYLVSGGGALLIDEANLDERKLLVSIGEIFSRFESFQEKAAAFRPHFLLDASRRLAEAIIESLPSAV